VHIDETTYLQERSRQLVRRAGLRRRDVLRLGAALPLAAGVAHFVGPTSARAAEAATSTPILKPLPPEWFVSYGSNAEMRWDSVADLGYRVPNERFFVRDHTSTPVIDERTWRLRVHGSGLRGPGIELSYDQLRRMPQRDIVTAIECAGNGRSFFGSQQGTPAPGTQWGLGAIGVARWRGVPLRVVLERAGISPSAVDVMPAGLDPTVVAGGVDYGHVRRPPRSRRRWTTCWSRCR
jgi:DMSO/TMAO reductase YedYZ molybdopterin-dependent catalytic subunit